MERPSYFNRRKGPDLWVKFIKFASFIVWFLMALVLVIVDKAKPGVEDFFSRILKINLRSNWDTNLLTDAFYLSILTFFFSLFALIINIKRHRRKADKYSKSLIIILCFSLVVILVFLFKP